MNSDNDNLIKQLNDLKIDEQLKTPETIVKITGFVQNQRIGKTVSFLTLRQGLETLQCVYTKKDLKKNSENDNQEKSNPESALQESKENLISSNNEKNGDISTQSNNEKKSDKKKKNKEKRARQTVMQPTESIYVQYTKIPSESFIKISGIILPAPKPILSTTIQNLEMHVREIEIINLSQEPPFNFKDASASLLERESLGLPSVKSDILFDNRSLDLRLPHTNALFKIIDGFLYYFRTFLRLKDFMEIKTPKLIESSSEGGANLFEVSFFKKKAYLAQSPQLYKQMAVIGGLQRVFEVGHVYRAEESNVNRYLSEFVGLDLELEIDNYTELIDLIYEMFTYCFKKIYEEYNKEITLFKRVFPFEDIKYTEKPCILTFQECRNMLKDNKMNINGDLEDFNREEEKNLGKLVKDMYKTDLFVIKDYPTKIRAFYTKFKNHTFSYSFDFILRGEEILSGARRIDNYNELLHSIKQANISENSLKGYLETFKYGVPIHGGCGIGFERLLKSFFDSKDIRLFTMFPRDPTRLYP